MTHTQVELTRCIKGQRLVYYRSKASAQFWDEHWKKHFSPEIYKKADRGHFIWFEKPFTQYLPKEGRILDAGCGLGQYVQALRVRGYDAEGIEWGAETVKTVHSLYPDLPIHTGDVTRIKVPDSYYSGYISLGVVEHCQEGPELFLYESYRVLKPGGVALFSVPYFHPLRRLKAKLGFFRDCPNDLEFYQYAFSKNEFSALLQKVGFEIVDKMIYDGFKGVKDEIPLLKKVFQWPVIGWRLRRWVRSCKWIEHTLGHMILFVCQKV